MCHVPSSVVFNVFHLFDEPLGNGNQTKTIILLSIKVQNHKIPLGCSLTTNANKLGTMSPNYRCVILDFFGGALNGFWCSN